jgi:hypothetical protein
MQVMVAKRDQFGTGPAYHRVSEINMKARSPGKTQHSKGLSLGERGGEELAKAVLLKRRYFNPG